MGAEKRARVLGVANIFVSIPMTLNELSKRTGLTEEEALQYFNNDLKTIDYDKYLSVQRILKFLSSHKVKAVS